MRARAYSTNRIESDGIESKQKISALPSTTQGLGERESKGERGRRRVEKRERSGYDGRENW